MAGHASRRQLLSGLGAGAVGTVIGAATADLAEAAAPTVRGTWLIQPSSSRGPAPFQALAAFAAGGVFITTGSDEAGTGLGEWSQTGASHFGFSYLNFHFDSAGKLTLLHNDCTPEGAPRFSVRPVAGTICISALGSCRLPPYLRTRSPMLNVVSLSRRACPGIGAGKWS